MFHNDVKIYNIAESVEILELFDDMKDSIDESQWNNVIRKAVKKTGVAEKDAAVAELTELLAD